jgi:hypothetical protein
MSKLYHYTGIKQFSLILGDEQVMSSNARLARDIAKQRGIAFKEAWLYLQKGLSREIESDSQLGEIIRNNFVYFSRDFNHPAYDGVSADAHKRGEMVILGFNADKHFFERLKPIPLARELSLEHLIEVHSQPPVLSQVRHLLETMHGGKYRRIPIYDWLK